MGHEHENRFASLYERHRSAIWLYCRRRVGVDGADDAMSDVYLTVWRRIEEAPSAETALPWLYRIAYLTVSNHWRTVRRKNRLREKATAMGVTTPKPLADEVVVREEVRLVVTLLQELREPDAEVLRLAAWEQLNTAEIGAVLGIEPGAAKQRLSRARKRLTQMYEKKEKTIESSPPLLGKEVSGER